MSEMNTGEYSQEQWEAAENRVNQAESSRRNADEISFELQKALEVSGYDRVEIEGMAEAPNELDALELEMALQVEEINEARKTTEELLGAEDSGERSLVKFRWGNLVKSLRSYRSTEEQISKFKAQEAKLLPGTLTTAKTRALETIRGKIETAKDKLTEIKLSNPEAYYGINLRTLKSYRQALNERGEGKGKIVEIPYVEKSLDIIMPKLIGGQPVFLHGHLGSGKTELACYAAREIIEQIHGASSKESAKVISGSKEMSASEIYGHQSLSFGSITPEKRHQVEKEIEKAYESWKAEHPEATEHEQTLAHDRIKDTRISELEGGTISSFEYGPIYEAMEKGLPIIIDEVNAIPHDILIGLNHLITRRPGDKISVQQNSQKEIVVARGFCVIMTGNLNGAESANKYIGRQDLDPAFVSRLYPYGYDYPPQEIEGALEEAAGKKNELYQLIISRLLSKNGNLIAPEGSLQELWKLAKAARIFQDSFSGTDVGDGFYYEEAGGRRVKYNLQEGVLSVRALEQVLSEWRGQGFKNDLDYYVYHNFVSTLTNPSDKAYVFQILHERFGFFEGQGWPAIGDIDYGSEGSPPNLRIDAPEGRTKEIVFYGPREVVEAAFGKPPKRAEWPKLELKPEESRAEDNATSRLEELYRFNDSLPAQLAELERLLAEAEAEAESEFQAEADKTVA